jgi:hypothetical protein
MAKRLITASDILAGHVSLDVACLDRIYPADGASARAGRAVLAAPRIPDPLSRAGGEDGEAFTAARNPVPRPAGASLTGPDGAASPTAWLRSTTSRRSGLARTIASFQRVFTAATRRGPRRGCGRCTCAAPEVHAANDRI